MKDVPNYELSVGYTIYDNENGEIIKVEPDPDDLGCVQITDDETHILIPPEMALLVSQALERCARDILNKK
jgi:hypothetical protein